MKKFFKAVAILSLSLSAASFAAVALFLMVPTDSEINIKTLEATIDFISFYDRHNDPVHGGNTGRR
ncbi:MAG: hypothetical protein ILP02_01640, partial [Clostridia bacterium]|nr:hypothetical protein [Clostridia bacterium]